ncbi:MAG: BREX system ATP-binding protein BrxD, partial [bacterium]|nr:BREX system ATP-binding protein BrxD [bacterium]
MRQLMDMLASEDLPGLYLVVTGTPDFFDGYKGLKGLAPLYQRVAVKFDDSEWDNLKAVQVRLHPFDRGRLLDVGRRVRDLYPASSPERLAARVGDDFLDTLVAAVTSGFGGQVSVTPRIFLRELVDVIDRVDQHADFDPGQRYRLQIDDDELQAEELAARHAEQEPAAAEEPRRR